MNPLVTAQSQDDFKNFEELENRVNKSLMNGDQPNVKHFFNSFTKKRMAFTSFDDEFYANGFGIAGLNGTVFTITEYQDTFCIGGDFTSFNSDIPLGRIACFNIDDGVWSSLGSLNGQVSDLQVYNGDLYAGGNFKFSENAEVNFIARWNGSQWEAVGSGFDGPVESLTVHKGKLVAAGEFQRALTSVSFGSDLYTGIYTVKQQEPSNSTAGAFGNGWIFFEQQQFDVELQETVSGRKFTAVPSPASGFDLDEREYRLLFLEPENIVTLEREVSTGLQCESGIFYSAAVDSFGTFDPQNDSTFTFSVRENSRQDCDVPAEDIMFTATKTASKNKNTATVSIFQNGIAAWNGESWEGFGDGFVNENGSLSITDLISVNDTLYVSGNFTKSGDTDLNSVAYWDETNNIWVPVGNPFGENITTSALSWYNDRLIAGRNIFPDSTSSAVKKWNSTVGEWEPLGSNLQGGVLDLHVKGTELYAGTDGFSFNGVANGLARWDETSETWVGVVSTEISLNSINSIASIDNELIVGGLFFEGANSPRNPVRNVAWIEQNGNMFTKEELDFANTKGLTNNGGLNPGLGMDSYVFENNIIVGGSFDHAGNVPAKNIALWNGSEWEAMGDGLQGTIRSLVTFGGQLHAANLFGDASRGQVSRWNSSIKEWEPLGDPLGGVSEAGVPLTLGIWRMVVYNDTLYAAGEFNKEGGSIADLIAKWNPGEETWEEVGEGFQGGNRVRGITVYNGELYVGGHFSSSGNTEVNNVARWDEATRSWQPVGDGLDGGITVLTVLDGELHAAGDDDFQISKWVDSTQTWVPKNQGIEESAFMVSLDEVNGEFFAGGFAENDFLYRWDKQQDEWVSLGSGTNNGVYRMSGLNGKLHIPGWFTEAGGQPALGFTTYDIEVATSNEDEIFTELPGKVELMQNYPNPFNPSTRISYTLPQAQSVRLDVYNILGQQVANLVNGPQRAGLHNVTFDASNLSSGIYIYRMQAGSITKTKKMLLLK